MTDRFFGPELESLATGDTSIPSCPSQAELLDLIAGRLPQQRHDELDAHIRGCGRCQAELNALEDPDDEFLSAVQGALNPDLIRSMRPLRDVIAELELYVRDSSDRPNVGNVTICPKCRQVVELIEGRAARCPRCGATISIGGPASGQRVRHEGAANVLAPADELASINCYRFVRELASSHICTLFLAHDPESGKNVVLKLRKRRLRSRRKSLEDFTREREILTALSHPNIVSVLDLGIHEGLPFAAYDYVRGQTLKEMLTPKIDREVALRFLVGIARGLQYAHDKGVVHRGVKPSNILIDSNQRAHLTDFGLAAPEALHDDFTAMESVSEKIVYLAPEQAAGTMSRVDGRTDVYGLGIVLYEVLTGTVPFHGFPEVVLGQVCRTAPPKLRGIDRTIDKKLEAICLTAIEKEPADRFQSAEEFANRIEEWLAAARLRALRGSWLRRFRSWFGRPDGKRRPENSGPPAGDK